MSDIFPAEGQSVSDVIADLTKLGLTDGTDFRTHWTWDMRPYVKAEPDAYKKWQSKHGDDAEADKAADSASDADETKAADDDKDTKSNSESGDDKGSTSRKRGGK